MLIEEAAIAAKVHSIFTANRSRIVRSCLATAAFAHGYVSVPQAIDRISGLITATERRPLDLPAQRRRRAPRRGSSQHLPICEQSIQALFLFDVCVSIVNQFEPPEGTVVESMEGKLPVNVRAINGIDFKALRVDQVDGKTWRGPPYEV